MRRTKGTVPAALMRCTAANGKRIALAQLFEKYAQAIGLPARRWKRRTYEVRTWSSLPRNSG